MDLDISSPPDRAIAPETLESRFVDAQDRVLALVLHTDAFAKAAWSGGRRRAQSIERRALFQLCALCGEEIGAGDVVIHTRGSEYFAIAFIDGTRNGMDLRRLAEIERAVTARVEIDCVLGWTWIDRTDDVRKILCTAGKEARLRQQRREFAALLHDVATPLSSIHSSLSAVLDGVLDAATERRFLTTARDEAARAGRLIRDFLTVESADAALSDLQSALQRAVEVTEPIARVRDVTIRMRSDERSAIVAIGADEAVAVITALLENAVKHGRTHGVVHADIRTGDAVCELTIDDDGPGVADGDRVFDYGFRRGRGSGSGIGLARARKIVEMRRGTIGVGRSILGGARFTLTLPVRQIAG